jgi:hypothetical protein
VIAGFEPQRKPSTSNGKPGFKSGFKPGAKFDGKPAHKPRGQGQGYGGQKRHDGEKSSFKPRGNRSFA